MKSNDRNIVRTAGTRCSLCSRPDRDDLDRDLVLQKKTQTEVAQLVGVDRSSVSRHVKNHLQPQIASEILLGEEFSVMNVVEELDRIYGRRQLAIERAGMAGDARLERDLLNSQQRLLFDVVKAVTQLGEGGLRYLEGLQNRNMLDRADEFREVIRARLEDIQRKSKKQDEFFATENGQQVLDRIEQSEKVQGWQETGEAHEG